MIDKATLKISSGKGGNGAISGRREKYVPRGGPDGGNGGDGGSVILRGDSSINTLLAYRYKNQYTAGNGGDGFARKKHGKNGSDIELGVPLGTSVEVVDSMGNRTLADMTVSGEKVCLAKGGRGGRGNATFSTSTNRYPLLAEQGETGQKATISLELKLLADVGIIGLPNAGKSSLLASLTAARPKIAAYPFSTLEPVLGVAEHNKEEIVLVDIPGLIEDAHLGAGLGHDFLRHIERTKILIHVVDGSGDDPPADYQRVRHELRRYNIGLLEKPEIVALNKSDIQINPDVYQGVYEELLKNTASVHSISAVTRIGLPEMMNDVLQAVTNLAKESPRKQAEKQEYEETEILRPKPIDSPITVRVARDKYIVEADKASRIAAMVDPHNWEAKAQLYGYLRRTGIIAALRKAGINSGDVFILGKKEWDWE